MSSTRCVGLSAKALPEPLTVGMMAIFDVPAPSPACNVAVGGCVCPCGHIVENPSGPGGTTVALNTYARAAAGTPQGLVATFTSRVPLKGRLPAGSRVSSTRQGATLYSERPPAPG